MWLCVFKRKQVIGYKTVLFSLLQVLFSNSFADSFVVGKWVVWLCVFLSGFLGVLNMIPLRNNLYKSLGQTDFKSEKIFNSFTKLKNNLK